MLMSDTWQPAVLHLLPFSPNDASLPPHPPSPSLTATTHSSRLRSLPLPPDSSRGFPVLAVTRKDKEGPTGRSLETSISRGAGRGAGAWAASSSKARAASERMTRSQTFVDSGSGLSSTGHPRAKSDYLTRRSAGVSAGGGAHGKAKSNGVPSRDQATCSITDINERIIPRVGLRPDTTSPDSGAGSLRNSPYVTSADAETLNHNGGGGSARGFPKPAFLANAFSPANSTAAGVIGNGSNSAGEGRYVVSKNGMWRSVTLTPGEMELKKHRDLLEKVTTVYPAPLQGDTKLGLQYHKMNIRDLPRSTTPVNDHDPDKLNMKQVIAFLQSKGKSQADAVELPRRLKGKGTQAVTLPQTIKSGVLRGSIRKPTASSTAAEVVLWSSGRHSTKEPRDGSSPPSPVSAHRGESGGDGLRRSSSLPLARNSTARSSKYTAREAREHRGEHRQEKPDSHSSPHKLQKKPFRLHRFLTIVPSAREPVTHSSASFASANTCPLYTPVPLLTSSSKSTRKERTLCLDLASQSKSQTTQSKGETTDSRHYQGKVHYRLAASRPRPSSLRVEQDFSETQWKLSADFGDHETSGRVTTYAESTKDPKTKETKNVIRLPFVMVDSEEEDTGLAADSRRSVKSQAQKHSRQTTSSRRGSDTKQSQKDGTAEEMGVDGLWPSEVKEAQDLQSSSQISTSSSLLPVPTESSSSLPTVSYSDLISDPVEVVEDVVDKLPDVVSDQGLVQLTTQENSVRDVNNERPQTNRKVKVNVPSHNGFFKDNATKLKTPDCVTLSLRKERHRTRENTYMSDIAGSDVFSDDTCAARINSKSVRMSPKVMTWPPGLPNASDVK